MASIASAALILSTQATKLYEGLDQAQSKITSWATSVPQQIKGAFSGLSGASLLGPLAAGIGAGLAVFDVAIDKIKELSNVGRQAKSLGVATDQFMGLSQAAKKFGIDGDEMFHMMTKLSETTFKAGSSNKELGKTLNDIGVSMDSLQGKSPDQKFLTIADALSKVPDSGQRANAAMELFGKSGYKMLPMLDQGAEGIQKFIDKAKQMGTALGEVDMKKLDKARTAISGLGDFFEGFKNKILVAISPLVELVGNKISKVIEFVQPFFDKAARAIAKWYEVLYQFYEELGDWIQGGIDEIKNWFGNWDEIKAKFPTVEEIILNAMQNMGKAIAYVVDSIKAIGGAATIGFGYVVDGVNLCLMALKQLLDIAGKLPDTLGGSQFKQWAKEVASTQQPMEDFANRMKNWGKNQIGNFGDGAKAVDRFFDRIRNKKIEVDIEPKAGSILQKLADGTEKLPGLELEGSKEAYKTQAEFQYQGMTSKDQQQVQQLKDVNKNLTDQQKLLQQIATALGSGVILGTI